jgi:hypothetical protein
VSLRARNLGIVLACCLIGAMLAVVLSRGQSASLPKCRPATLGQQSVPNAIEAVVHEQCLRDVYGGDELEHDRIHIFVANHGQRLIRAALAPIATPAAYFFSAVPNTWATLSHDVLEVSAVALKGGSGWKATVCYPDPARSSVIVQVHGDTAAAGAQLHQRFPDTPVRIVKDTTGGGVQPVYGLPLPYRRQHAYLRTPDLAASSEPRSRRNAIVRSASVGRSKAGARVRREGSCLSISPGSNAAQLRRGDPGDEARRLELRRRKHRIGPHVDARQFLQQSARATLLNTSQPVNDEILAQSSLVERRGFNRQHHARVALDVTDLQPALLVCRQDVVPVESDPDTADLRTAVGIQGNEMGQRSRFQ